MKFQKKKKKERKRQRNNLHNHILSLPHGYVYNVGRNPETNGLRFINSNPLQQQQHNTFRIKPQGEKQDEIALFLGDDGRSCCGDGRSTSPAKESVIESQPRNEGEMQERHGNYVF